MAKGPKEAFFYILYSICFSTFCEPILKVRTNAWFLKRGRMLFHVAFCRKDQKLVLSTSAPRSMRHSYPRLDFSLSFHRIFARFCSRKIKLHNLRGPPFPKKIKDDCLPWLLSPSLFYVESLSETVKPTYSKKPKLVRSMSNRV